MPTIVLDGESLGWPELRALSRDFLQTDCRLRVSPAALRKVVRSRETVERAVLEGRTIYGINTGFGKLSETRIDAARLDASAISCSPTPRAWGSPSMKSAR